MAIYSCTATIVGRSRRRQACSAAAYQARCEIFDERQGLRFGYDDRDGEELLASEMLLPLNAPDWDRPKLWNEVEKAERRKDAQTARSIRVALPRELTLVQMVQLLRRFLKRQFVNRGLAVDYAVHDKEASTGGRQPHAHVLVTMRTLLANGFSKKKDRTTLARPEKLERFRAAWAVAVNVALRAAGVDATIDHRSLKRQRTEIETLLKDPGLSQAEQNSLKAHLHRLSYLPEPKVSPRVWKIAKAKGALPEQIENARDARSKAADRSFHLLGLLKSRDELLPARMASDTAPQMNSVKDMQPKQLESQELSREAMESNDEAEIDATEMDHDPSLNTEEATITNHPDPSEGIDILRPYPQLTFSPK